VGGKGEEEGEKSIGKRRLSKEGIKQLDVKKTKAQLPLSFGLITESSTRELVSSF